MRNVLDGYVILGKTKRIKQEMVRNEMKTLTPRQAEAASVLAQGGGSKEIAQALGIAETTARVMVQQARERVGARTVAHLVAISIRKGFINVLSVLLVISMLTGIDDGMRRGRTHRVTQQRHEVSAIYA